MGGIRHRFGVSFAAGLPLLALFCSAQPITGHAACQPSTNVVASPRPPDDECDPGGFPIDFFDTFSWRTFIALNWPADPDRRGVPDETKTIADRTAPRVWETWKSVEETFLPDGRTPESWDSPGSNRLCTNAQDVAADPKKLLADLNQGDDNGGGIGALVAQNRTYVRYEIRMNQKEFETILLNKLFLRSNLPASDSSEPQQELFEDGAVDVKAAWREIRTGENADRYYIREALAVDPITGRCDLRQFALIGFHIAARTLTRPQWIWSTFEHVDNIEPGPGAPVGTVPSLNDPGKPQMLGTNPGVINAANPLKVDPDPVQVVFESSENRVPSETEATNTKWQGSPELKDSVFKFYRLIKTQWPSDPSGNALGRPFPKRRVANLTMETFIQSSSCMACHGKASNKTDFVWFLSNRAFPIKDNLLSNAKVLKDHTKVPVPQ